jgi:hypothetical protein
MANDGTRISSSAQAPDQTGASAKRALYERPALTHLGSVNRLTLAGSGTLFTDGTSRKNVVG